MVRFKSSLWGAALVIAMPLDVAPLASGLYEQPPIRYSATTPSNAVQRLEERLVQGDFVLPASDRDALAGLLRELQLPIESQLLVFSKTSLQRNRIGPRTPRAIYFSDECYVGWVPGGLVEVAIIDRHLGPVFYAFDPRPTEAAAGSPRFKRDAQCLSCHGGSLVRGIPGVLARSVFPDAAGEPLLQHGSVLVDYRTTFEERWGGWYVTGQHGTARHRGNTVAQDRQGELLVDLVSGANSTNLATFFDARPYLADTSDIVALLVFEHQIAVHAALVRARFDCLRLMAYQANLQRELKEPVTEEPVWDSVKRVVDNAARDVVDALLFKDEAALPAGLQGANEFRRVFEGKAPRTSAGDSLRALSLEGRLFQNRCSYLIHSELFRQLPRPLLARIHHHLGTALVTTPAPQRYAYLAAEEQQRILRILRETEPELAANIAQTAGRIEVQQR
jgi:hypothetical protein